MDDLSKIESGNDAGKKPVKKEDEVNIGFTRVMKDYKSLKLSAKRYLLMTLIISIAAIIIGVGIYNLSTPPSTPSTVPPNKPQPGKKPSDIRYNNANEKAKEAKSNDENEENSLLGKILASITGLLSGGTLLSTLLSAIRNKDDNDEFFVSEHPTITVKKIEKLNRKLRAVRNKYRVISILGALLLIGYTAIIIKDTFFSDNKDHKDNNNYDSANDLNDLNNIEPCQVFMDCLDFMRSQNLTVGEFTIVCNVTGLPATPATPAAAAPATPSTSVPVIPTAATPVTPVTAASLDKLSVCQINVMGCKNTGIFDVHLSYYEYEYYKSEIPPPDIPPPYIPLYVQIYFEICYDYSYNVTNNNYNNAINDKRALGTTLIGVYGVIHYICVNTILSILHEPKELEGCMSVFAPIILLNLSIVGLFPGCCCCCRKRKVENADADYDYVDINWVPIDCANINSIKVPRIVFTSTEEDELNKFKRKKEGYGKKVGKKNEGELTV